MRVHGHHWSNIWPKPRPNTIMSSLKQHRTKAITQYQNVEFSMDDRDWFDMIVHGHHWNNIWPHSRPNTNMFNLVWMIGVSFGLCITSSRHISTPHIWHISTPQIDNPQRAHFHPPNLTHIIPQLNLSAGEKLHDWQWKRMRLKLWFMCRPWWWPSKSKASTFLQ